MSVSSININLGRHNNLILIMFLALGASVFSGCSKEEDKAEVKVTPRAEDPVYKKELKGLRAAQVKAHKERIQIQKKIAALGEHPETKPEYVDLTNRLAQCVAERKKADKVARDAIRARIMKEARAKKNATK